MNKIKQCIAMYNTNCLRRQFIHDTDFTCQHQQKKSNRSALKPDPDLRPSFISLNELVCVTQNREMWMKMVKLYKLLSTEKFQSFQVSD